jgi:hypothetical protein
MNAWSAPLKRPSLVLAVCLSLVATVSHSEEFRFDWPLDVAVAVTAAVTKKGNSSTASYRVNVSAGDGGELELGFHDFKFLTLNGVDARERKVLAQLGPLAALSSLPRMRLSLRGEYLGTRGLQDVMAAFLEGLADAPETKQREQLADYFQSPRVQAVMEQKAAETSDIWNTWVGAWNGLELESGQTLRGTVPIKVMDRDLEQSVLIEHLGPAGENCPTCVRLRMTTVVDGPEVLQLVSGLLGELGGNNAATSGQFISARSMSITEVFTEAASLMPIYAMSNREVLLRDAANESHSQHDRKEYWFEWK